MSWPVYHCLFAAAETVGFVLPACLQELWQRLLVSVSYLLAHNLGAQELWRATKRRLG